MPSVPFSYYTDRFLNYLAIERNYSGHTTVNYRIDLDEFSIFLESAGCRHILSIYNLEAYCHVHRQAADARLEAVTSSAKC